MSKSLFVGAGLLFVAMIALLIIGFTSNTPGLLITSILCAMPLFCLMLGAAVGKASNELVIVSKERLQSSSQRISRVSSSSARAPESLG